MVPTSPPSAGDGASKVIITKAFCHWNDFAGVTETSVNRVFWSVPWNAADNLKPDEEVTYGLQVTGEDPTAALLFSKSKSGTPKMNGWSHPTFEDANKVFGGLAERVNFRAELGIFVAGESVHFTKPEEDECNLSLIANLTRAYSQNNVALGKRRMRFLANYRVGDYNDFSEAIYVEMVFPKHAGANVNNEDDWEVLDTAELPVQRYESGRMVLSMDVPFSLFDQTGTAKLGYRLLFEFNEPGYGPVTEFVTVFE